MKRLLLTMSTLTMSTLTACGEDPVPQCADLRHSPITVDTTGDVTGFSWDGDAPHGFAVVDAEGLPQWELLCACPADCDRAEDWAARACLPPAVTYGEVPAGASFEQTDVQLEALPLVAGATYTAVIWSDCDAEGQSRVVRSEDFVVQ